MSFNSLLCTESGSSSSEPVADEKVDAYLSRIQRGGIVQRFGCLLAIEESSFEILAYSQNSLDMLLGINTHYEPLLGFDARILFTPPSSESLMIAIDSEDISFSNPVWVMAENIHQPFLAILRKIDSVGVVIDFEPAVEGDPAFSLDGVVRSQTLALGAISRLQLFPRGDIGLPCDALVNEIKYFGGHIWGYIMLPISLKLQDFCSSRIA